MLPKSSTHSISPPMALATVRPAKGEGVLKLNLLHASFNSTIEQLIEHGVPGLYGTPFVHRGRFPE